MDSKIKGKLQSDLDKKVVSSKILLNRFRLIQEADRQSGAYQDPNWLPFYYHLGKYIKGDSLMEIGFSLGLPSCCFMQRQQISRFLKKKKKVKDEKFYPNLGLANIRQFKVVPEFHLGELEEIEDQLEKGWDIFLVGEKISHDLMRNHLDILWNHLNSDGFMIVDYLSDKSTNEAFSAFCKISNREPVLFDTRYGIGIVQK